MNIHKLAE